MVGGGAALEEGAGVGTGLGFEEAGEGVGVGDEGGAGGGGGRVFFGMILRRGKWEGGREKIEVRVKNEEKSKQRKEEG